jgi:hypothetical protein
MGGYLVRPAILSGAKRRVRPFGSFESLVLPELPGGALSARNPGRGVQG